MTNDRTRDSDQSGRQSGSQMSQRGSAAETDQNQRQETRQAQRPGQQEQQNLETSGRGRFQRPRGASRMLDPWTGFRTDIERMFENFLGAASSSFPAFPRALFGDGESSFLAPSVDIKDNDKAVKITAELPGLKEDDIDLSLRDGVLTLRGEKRLEQEDERENVYVCERRYGTFERSFRLPDTVNTDACEASFENGVLHITLPKRPEAASASKRIPIGGK